MGAVCQEEECQEADPTMAPPSTITPESALPQGPPLMSLFAQKPLRQVKLPLPVLRQLKLPGKGTHFLNRHEQVIHLFQCTSLRAYLFS